MMEELRQRLTAGVRAAPDADAAARQVVETLADEQAHYSWVGIYWVDGEDLVLGPWKGPQATEHTRIPIGVGVCGAAAASGRTEVVDDVHGDERYLACFPSTRSEVVVPIHDPGGTVIGEIDVDGDTPAAFGDADVGLLEAVAAELGARGGGS